MDIWVKHIQPDKNGVRIAELDEMSYRRNLWSYRPSLTSGEWAEAVQKIRGTLPFFL